MPENLYYFKWSAKYFQIRLIVFDTINHFNSDNTMH